MASGSRSSALSTETPSKMTNGVLLAQQPVIKNRVQVQLKIPLNAKVVLKGSCAIIRTEDGHESVIDLDHVTKMPKTAHKVQASKTKRCVVKLKDVDNKRVNTCEGKAGAILVGTETNSLVKFHNAGTENTGHFLPLNPCETATHDNGQTGYSTSEYVSTDLPISDYDDVRKEVPMATNSICGEDKALASVNQVGEEGDANSEEIFRMQKVEMPEPASFNATLNVDCTNPSAGSEESPKIHGKFEHKLSSNDDSLGKVSRPMILQPVSVTCLKSKAKLKPKEIAKHKDEAVVKKSRNKRNLCWFCDKVFASSRSLRTHMMRHLKPKSLKPPKPVKIERNCPICNKIFKTDKRYQMHVESHTEKSLKTEKESTRNPQRGKGHVCEVCGLCVMNLKSHLVTHLEQKPHECKECGGKFTTLRRLAQHVDIHQTNLLPEERKYRCEKCPMQFSLIDSFNRHVIKHQPKSPQTKHYFPRGGKTFTCSVCMEKFISLSEIQAHTRCVHPAKDVQCTLCLKVMKSSRDIKRHFLFQHAQRFPKQCRRCQMAFCTDGHLRTHIRKTHPELAVLYGFKSRRSTSSVRSSSRVTGQNSWGDGRPSTCDECGSRFRFKTTLICHLYRHRNKERVNLAHQCEECGKIFQSSSNLSNHLRTHQNDDEKISLRKRFFCTMCNRKFTKQANLTIHEHIIHKQGGMNCPICHKAISLEDSLRLHMATHTGESPSCNFCGKSFITKQTLNHHIASRHSDGKQAIGCAECGKGFKTYLSLKRHLHVHELDRPKICGYCDIGFVYFSKYIVHSCVVEGKTGVPN